ncbi:SigB/SigF/SigG family RNA polymerase sigma factor [Natroniella sulfidigena]|uniref:SigB/SigF/SigG family RNA polymerase sigma factor n=1 Tax=Natroniella sulfidigena TaxID=723921 RepID=UPI00200B259C|nr:SigB/SigF/SigG family RNA polymerase sigma factor [Natroniella sulfidigena]MCK8816590.1 SigB/SigF/SigG family RNA polymerase sigma factor [Natroniella sulfidigena]
MEGLANINLKEQKLLSQEETKRLLGRSQQGEQEATDKLVKHNLRLVLKIAHRFKNATYSLEDIFQIGIIGLMKAIKRFDLNKGVNFSTYAVPVIIGEIKVFLRDNDRVKISRTLKQRASKIKQIKEEMKRELKREPTIKELSQRLDLDSEEIIRALEAVQEPTSLYTKVYNEDGGGSKLELIDRLADSNDEYEASLNKLFLKQILEKVDQRAKKLIKLRYFANQTQSQVARELEISQAHVSRLEKKILTLMKNKLKKKDRC